MIQSENPPTLCPRCMHFTMGTYAGCKIGNYGIDTGEACMIQRWRRTQIDESSWTFMGPCPGFEDNGSSPHLMSAEDQRALRKLLERRVEVESQ